MLNRFKLFSSNIICEDEMIIVSIKASQEHSVPYLNDTKKAGCHSKYSFILRILMAICLFFPFHFWYFSFFAYISNDWWLFCWRNKCFAILPFRCPSTFHDSKLVSDEMRLVIRNVIRFVFAKVFQISRVLFYFISNKGQCGVDRIFPYVTHTHTHQKQKFLE